jgi:GNAT superfamily N-acetyltransferase
MSDPWLVRRARPEETEEVLRVRNSAYPTAPLSQSLWDWRYAGLPDTDAAILVADHRENIIGLQPLASFAVQVEGELGRACMLTGVVTHPEYRRRGVFSSLITQSVEQARERGNWLVYTFPNQLSFPGFMKVGGWIHVGSLPLYLKVLDLDAVLEKRVTNRWLRRILVGVGNPGLHLLERVRPPQSRELLIRQVNCWDERADELWARVCSEYRVIVRRDRAYLTWRYLEHPEEEYMVFQAESRGELLGYTVVKATDLFGLRSGLIVDILALSPQISDYLIAQALAYFRAIELEVAGALITDSLFYPRSFRRNGFVRCPSRLCPKEFYFVCHIIAPEAADAASLQNWFLTWGDTDNV